MQHMERFKMIASGYGLVRRGPLVLLSRRYNTGYMDGWYSLPAGHIEDGESLISGTCRELAEEIGVTINPADLRLSHVMHRKEQDIRMDFFFDVLNFAGEPANREPEKCSGIAWFPVNALPDGTIPYIRAAITRVQQGIGYSEFGWTS